MKLKFKKNWRISQKKKIEEFQLS